MLEDLKLSKQLVDKVNEQLDCLDDMILDNDTTNTQRLKQIELIRSTLPNIFLDKYDHL